MHADLLYMRVICMMGKMLVMASMDSFHDVQKHASRPPHLHTQTTTLQAAR